LNFLEKLEHDDFTMQFKLNEADRFAKKIDSAFSRLSFSLVFLAISIIIAGAIVGLGLGAYAGIEALILTILKASLIIAGIMIVILIISVFRSNRF